MAVQDYQFQGWESPRSVIVVTDGCHEFSSSDGSSSDEPGNSNSVLTLLPLLCTLSALQ